MICKNYIDQFVPSLIGKSCFQYDRNDITILFHFFVW